MGRETLAGNPTPQLDADLLLGAVLGLRRDAVLTAETEIAPERLTAYRELLARRASGEPVAYLTGSKWWFGLELSVSSDVLVPRPETEVVAEHAIEAAERRAARSIVDVGTGSGAIAIALALRLTDVHVVATDSSEPALSVAARNVDRHALANRVELVHGDLIAPISHEPHVIVANLPYIPDGDKARLSPEVLCEPPEALFAGPDGLYCISRLLEQIGDRAWRSSVVLEIDPRQVPRIEELVNHYLGPRKITFGRDLAGRYRVATIETLTRS